MFFSYTDPSLFPISLFTISKTLIILKNKPVPSIPQVVWQKEERSPDGSRRNTLLTMQDMRKIDDGRFNVIRPTDPEWNLQITDVEAADEGRYLCMVNTQVPRHKVITLYVRGEWFWRYIDI